MDREGPVLYCKDNTEGLAKVLIPEEELCFTALQLVKSCCAVPHHLYLAHWYRSPELRHEFRINFPRLSVIPREINKRI